MAKIRNEEKANQSKRTESPSNRIRSRMVSSVEASFVGIFFSEKLEHNNVNRKIDGI